MSDSPASDRPVNDSPVSDGGVHPADAATRAEILAVEARRREALLAVDIPALDELFDPWLVHIHAPGLTHTKAQLLEHVALRQAYLDMTRGELTIRVIGDVAIMSGRLVNLLSSPDGIDRLLGGAVTQVLLRGPDGRWRFVHFQMTPDGDQVWPALPSELAASANATANPEGES